MIGPLSSHASPTSPECVQLFGAGIVGLTPVLYPQCAWTLPVCLSRAVWLRWGPCERDHGLLTPLCDWHVIEERQYVRHAVETGMLESMECAGPMCSSTGNSFRYTRVSSHRQLKEWWHKRTGVQL